MRGQREKAHKEECLDKELEAKTKTVTYNTIYVIGRKTVTYHTVNVI